MRITCPACNVSYDVPDAMIGAGRSVRCARCLREWQPQPAATLAHTDEAVPPAETAFPAFDAAAHQAEDSEAEEFDTPPPDRPRFTADDLDPPAPRPPADPHAWRDVLLAQGNGRQPSTTRRDDGWIGWLASLALLLALAGAAIAWRGAVQHAWPPSIRVYAALGLRQARPGALPPVPESGDPAKGSPLESPSK